jgi:four helix bundle protein
MTVNNIEDLVTWQLARELSKDIYVNTNTPEFLKDYRFCAQIRAAVGSIMDNIAEGFEREGNKEFIQFLYIAKGSCGEVKSQLYRASDVGYITNEKFSELLSKTKDVKEKITSLIRYLKQSYIKGKKYKQST